MKSVELAAMSELDDHPLSGEMGFWRVFWRRKKQILKQKYGLDWRSIAELNPHMIFDLLRGATFQEHELERDRWRKVQVTSTGPYPVMFGSICQTSTLHVWRPHR